MKKRYVLKNKKKFFMFIATISLLIFTTLFASSVYGYKEPSYKEVVIRNGDTLWDIAERYNKQDDVRELIYKIKKVNNLSSSNIYEGNKIMIPLD